MTMPDRRGRRGRPVDPSERGRTGEFARPNSIMAARVNEIARNTQQDLNDVISDEPPEELADSELSDWERQQAIARERTRREGLT
jgi:hypothetical protein